MLSGVDQRTFRVRGIPPAVKPEAAGHFFRHVIPGVTSTDNIYIGSFAPTADDFSRPASSTATVRFRLIPEILQNGAASWEFAIPGHERPLSVDSHFVDFTTLNRVDPGSHEYDCIAISGLASHPFGSWKQRAHHGQDHDFMWLRDGLARDQPTFRIMTYGYDTSLVGSHSFQTIDHIALQFVSRLINLRPVEQAQKPLIVLAHSLGGVILKRALLYLATGGEIYTHELKALKLAVLFGVPNKGMQTSHLFAMVQSQPNAQLIQDLCIGSKYLSDLHHSFTELSVLSKIKLVAAFETMQSPTVIMSKSGKWERNGPLEILVTEDSAIVEGAEGLFSKFPIHQDHSNMVKFTVNDPGYRNVLAVITANTMAQISPAQTHSRSQRISTQIIPGRNSVGRDNRKLKGTRLTTDEFVELRSSLDFAEIHHREGEIQTAQPDTFAWVFDNEQLKFSSWLQSRTGMYWIRGKPGSGKSTLMKFLSESAICKELLAFGQGGCKVIPIWFFFHDRGASLLQKSYEGLLRSLLLSIMNADGVLASVIFGVYFLQGSSWSLAGLEKALQQVQQQELIDVSLTLFLDALDEYHGAPATIVRVLTNLSRQSERSRTHIKICFASRPWDVFVKSFHDVEGFRIHEHTEDDMRKYVDKRVLGSNALSQLLRQASVEDVKDFVDTIVLRAEGVFLWVRLIVDMIQDRIKNATKATLLELRKLLSDLPDDLETYYIQTLDRIPDGNRHDAYIILEIVYRCEETVWLDELFYALACAKCSTYQQSALRLKVAEQSQMSQDEMSRQLKNLCGGLIEVVTDTRPRVQFIHLTVKEFLNEPHVKQRMVGTVAKLRLQSENGHTYIAKFLLTKSSIMGTTLVENTTILRQAAEYFRRAELTTGVHMSPFLDSVPEGVYSKWRYAPRLLRLKKVIGSGSVPLCNSPSTFAICADLTIYMRHCLSRSASVNKGAIVSDTPSLRCVALCMVHLGDILSEGSATEPLGSPSSYISLVDQILSSYPESDIEPAFKLLLQTNLVSAGEPCLQPINWQYLEIAHLLLEAGQDPNVKLEFRFNESFEVYTCRPLHIPVFLALELIDGGANVNELDSDGHTPLDIWVRYVLGPYVGDWNLGLCQQVIDALRARGGHLTAAGERLLEQPHSLITETNENITVHSQTSSTSQLSSSSWSAISKTPLPQVSHITTPSVDESSIHSSSSAKKKKPNLVRKVFNSRRPSAKSSDPSETWI